MNHKTLQYFLIVGLLIVVGTVGGCFFLSETKAVNGTAFSSNSEVGQGNVYSAGNAKADENKESTKVVLNEDFTPIWEHKDIENLVAGVYSTDGELIENWDSLIASDKLIIEEHGGVRCLFCNYTNIGHVLVVDENIWFLSGFIFLHQ